MVSHGVRDRLAECERLFRDAEPDGARKDEAARRCQNLCRQRVVDELERHTDSAADHLDAVLRAIDLRRRSKKSAIGDGQASPHERHAKPALKRGRSNSVNAHSVTRDEARRIAANIAKPPEYCAGNSKSAFYKLEFVT